MYMYMYLNVHMYIIYIQHVVGCVQYIRSNVQGILYSIILL